MTHRVTNKSLILAALLGCSTLSPVSAQENSMVRVQGEAGNGMSIPKVLLPRPPAPPVQPERDNLGNHTATESLKMDGNIITNMLTNVDDMGSSVNMQTLLNYVNGIEGDNLGDHQATTVLDMSLHKVVNVADAYEADDHDAVNLGTLKRYLNEIPGDNLGNHIATTKLRMNGNYISMGELIMNPDGTQTEVPGIMIGRDIIWGLTWPEDPSDAANKEYVDSRMGEINLSGVVYTTGDQQIDGTKSFVQTIVAQNGIDSGNQRIINLADPTADQDAVNLRTLRNAVGGIDITHPVVISQPYTTVPTATGVHSIAMGQAARAQGDRAFAGGFGSRAGVNSVAIGSSAVTGGAQDVVIGNGARNEASGAYNIILGNDARVTQGQYSVVLGFNAQASSPSTGGASIISIGEAASGSQQHSLAIGAKAVSTAARSIALGSMATASGVEGMAIGRSAAASGESGISVGTNSIASGRFGVAIGRGAQATAESSVAVGYNSFADQTLTFSVGSSSVLRRIVNVNDPVNPTDAVNLRTLQAAITARGDNLGNHIATQAINAANYKVENLADPTAAQDAVNLRTLNARIQTYAAGDGLSLAGNIFSVDSSVVRTSGNQSIAGIKTFTNPVQMRADGVKTINMQNAAGVSVATIDGSETDRSVRLNVHDASGVATGGLMVRATDGSVAPLGNSFFNANNRKVINVADPTDPADAVNLRTLQAAVNTSGDNLGNHIATRDINAASFKVINVATPTVGGDAANKTYVDNRIASIVDRDTTYTAGDGLSLAGTEFSVNTSVVRTSGNQSIAGTKAFTAPIVVTNTFDINGSSAGQQQNGLYLADLGTTSGTTLNPTMTAAIVGQISNIRSIGLSVDANGYLYGYRTHTDARTYTWQSRVRFADRLTTARTINGVSFDGSSNITIPTGASYTAGDGLTLAGTQFAVNGTVVRTTGDQSIGGVKSFNGSLVVETAGITPNLVIRRTGNSNNANMKFVTNTTGDVTIGQGDSSWFNIGAGDDVRYAQTGVFGVAATTGDVRWKGTATGVLNAANARVQMVADPTAPQDAVNLRTLQAALTSPTGDNLGNHVATTTLNLSNNRVINVGTPTAGSDATNKTYVDNIVANSTAAGDGISISRAGTVSTVAVNNTVVRTSGNQEIGGLKNFIGSNLYVSGANNNNLWFQSDTGVNRSLIFASVADNSFRLRNFDEAGAVSSELGMITDGRILPLRGRFDGNGQVISGVGDPVSGQDAVNLRSLQNYITAGSGIGFNKSTGTVAVDGTVVRTSGNQTISGTKSFSNTVEVGETVMTSNRFDTNGSFGFNMGPPMAGYGGTAGETLPSRTGVWFGSEVKTVGSNISDINNHASPLIHFNIRRPAGTSFIHPNDDGLGMIMQMSYRSVRMFRALELNDTFYQNSPNEEFSVYNRSTNFNTGAFNVSSHGLEVVFDTRRYRTDIPGGAASSRVLIYGRGEATGGFHTSSDSRLKKNIEVIGQDEGMEIVRRIEPVTFDMKEDGRHSAGVIAQQLREVMPYAVSETKDGTLVVEYSQMIAPMISAIQSLDDRVTALENAR